MRKKINNIINSGKEKIKRKKIEIGMLALINTVIGFNINADPLNLPKEYSENIAVKGYENDVFDYDFNNDGIDEKIVISYNIVDNLIGAVVSIYTNQSGKDILTYQITFDKKINILNLDEMPKLLNKVKEYYGEYSKNMASNETRHILIYDDNRNSEILFDKLKFDKHSPKDLDNFLNNKGKVLKFFNVHNGKYQNLKEIL